AAVGEIVFTASDAVQAAADGRDVILARPFTEADDVAGFHAAKGIVTSEGGKASHAALVARGMGVPAVTGASDLEIDVSAGEVRVDGIGLCRTEHMFFGEDRHEKMVQVILADDVKERRKRLEELAPLQQGDF